MCYRHPWGKMCHTNMLNHTQHPVKIQTTEVPWREESFYVDSKLLAFLFSNSINWMSMILFYMNGSYGPMWHEHHIFWPYSNTVSNGYKNLPWNDGGQLARGSWELCMDMLSNSWLNPQLWIASHFDWARKMNNQETRTGLVRAFQSFQTAAFCQMVSSVCYLTHVPIHTFKTGRSSVF